MFRDVVIVGMGLIGSSIAGAVRVAWPDVRIVGVDTDERTRRLAVEKGFADEVIDSFVNYHPAKLL